MCCARGGLGLGRFGAAEASQVQRAGYPGWGGLGLRPNPTTGLQGAVAGKAALAISHEAKALIHKAPMAPGPTGRGAVWQHGCRGWSLNPGSGRAGGLKCILPQRLPHLQGTQEPRTQTRLSLAQHSSWHQIPKRVGRQVSTLGLTIAGGRSRCNFSFLP